MTPQPDIALTPPALADALALALPPAEEAARSAFFKYAWGRSFDIASRYCAVDDAEDIASTVALRLWRDGMTESSDEVSSSAHDGLVRIATMRYVANLTRGRKRRVEHERLSMEEAPDHVPASAPSAPLEHRELERVLKLALAQLKPRPRQAWELTQRQGMSHPEAARAMGIAKGTVNIHVCEARRELQRTVGAYLKEGIMPMLIEQSAAALLSPTTVSEASS